MSDMNIPSASSSSAGVPDSLSGKQRSRSTGDLSKNLQSVKNKAEKKSEAFSRISSISRLPKGQPNIEASKSIKVPQGQGGRAQINQMGVYTLDAGNSGASTSLKINVPAKHVGDPLVKYSLAKMGNDETFVRTLDRKERMALIAADSEGNDAGNPRISTKGIRYDDKIIPWRNVIAWQKPETSTFDKPNNGAKLILFFREGEDIAVLNETTRLYITEMYSTKTLGNTFPAVLSNKSPELQNIKVSEYVDTLLHEFSNAVPERVFGIQANAKAMDSFGKDKLYHLQENINAMYTYSNGKNWEGLELSHRNRDIQALTRSAAKKNYAKEIKALSADWSKSATAGWSDNDKLRCAVIENVIKLGHANRISDADAKKYFPVILNGEKFRQYINYVYAHSDYRTALDNMARNNDFNAVRTMPEIPFDERAENFRNAIFGLKELESLTPKKIKRELKATQKALLRHLKQQGVSGATQSDALTNNREQTEKYENDIIELTHKLSLLKGKSYRKEITSLRLALKNITGPEPGSIEHMVEKSLSQNNVQNKYSQKGIDTLRALRDEKIIGLNENENKHERECLRQQIAWLDNHIESVVKTYYGFLSLKDKVIFLQRESNIAWGKYVDYLKWQSTPPGKELVRKYHHLAITRDSQLRYLFSAIKKIGDEKKDSFTFSYKDFEDLKIMRVKIKEPLSYNLDKKSSRSLLEVINSTYEFNLWAKKFQAERDKISASTTRNGDSSGVSINQNESLVDSENVKKSLEVESVVNIEKKDILKKQIIDEIDFQKFYSQIDGEIAVFALYSYLAAKGIRLNIVNADQKSFAPIEEIAKNREVDIGASLKTEKHVFIILNNGHYNGFDPEQKITYPSAGDGNCLFHSVANMLNKAGVDTEVNGLSLNQRTTEHLNNHFDSFTSAFFNPDDESEIATIKDEGVKKHTETLFRLVKEYKELLSKTVESGATTSESYNSGDDTLSYVLSDEGVVRESIDDRIDGLLDNNASLSKAKTGGDIPTVEDPLVDGLLATEVVMDQSIEPLEKDLIIDILTTETVTSQPNESVEDLNSDNTSQPPTGSTVSVGAKSSEFKITFNNEVYTLKNVKALEEMAKKTSNRTEKKALLKEIEHQKSIFKKINIPFEHVEFTENGMAVTEFQKQKNLLVQVKYFYDSNGKCNENATEYKPISGNGDLKIPGVNGKIYTIPGCTYKRCNRELNASRFYEYYKKIEEAKLTHSTHNGFIEYIDSLIGENSFDYIRTMTPLEQDDYRTQVGQISQRNEIDKSNRIIERYFQPQTVNSKSDSEQTIIINNHEINGLDLKLRPIVDRFPDIFEEYRKKGTKVFSPRVDDFCKDNAKEIRKILAENNLKLNGSENAIRSFMTELLHVESLIVMGTPCLLTTDESSVRIKSLLSTSSSGLSSKGLTSIKFKNGVDVPLNGLFVRKRYGAEVSHDINNKFNYPAYNTSLKGKEGFEAWQKERFIWQESKNAEVFNSRIQLDVVFPSDFIVQKVIEKNDIDEVLLDGEYLKYDASILNKMEVDEQKFIEIISDFGLKKTVMGLYQDENYKIGKHDDNSYCDFTMIGFHSKFASKFDKYFGEKYSDSSPSSVTASGDNPTAAASVKPASSSVNENVSQALSLQTLGRPQSLQEKAVNKEAISRQETLRKYSSTHLHASNSNAATIQNNEHEVADDQNTDNIKHHDESVISTDGVRQSQKAKETVNVQSSDLTPEKSLSIGTNLKLSIDNNGKYSFSPDIPKGSIHSKDDLQSWRVSSLQNKDDSQAFMALVHKQFVDEILTSDLKDEILTQALIHFTKINMRREDVSKYINKHKNKTDIFKVAIYKLTSSKTIKTMKNLAPNFNEKEEIYDKANILKSKVEGFLYNDGFNFVINEMEVPSDKENSLVSIRERNEDFLSMYRRMLVGPGGLIPDEGLAYRIYNGCLQVARIKDNAITSTSYSLTEGTKPKEMFMPNLVTTNMPIETNDAIVLSTFLDAKVIPITDPDFVKANSMEYLMSNMLEMAKKQGRDRSDTLLDDNDSHVSNPSESDENEAVAAQPSNETPAGKAPKTVFNKRELHRILSRRAIPA